MITQNKFPVNETESFIEKMLPKMQINGMIPLLFPNHPSIASKLCISPTGHPWT